MDYTACKSYGCIRKTVQSVPVYQSVQYQYPKQHPLKKRNSRMTVSVQDIPPQLLPRSSKNTVRVQYKVLSRPNLDSNNWHYKLEFMSLQSLPESEKSNFYKPLSLSRSGPRRTYRGRGEIVGVYLASQLERTPQLCS
jgi:hypothetical protein